MKKYNYYYNGQSITKSEFEKRVPKNWNKKVNKLGEYSYGYYKAVEREEQTS
jgi:hypothetical protein